MEFLTSEEAIVNGILATYNSIPDKVIGFFVYALQDPYSLEFRYIGQTTDPQNRERSHRRDASLNLAPGVEPWCFIWVELAQLDSKSDMDALEKELILEFQPEINICYRVKRTKEYDKYYNSRKPKGKDRSPKQVEARRAGYDRWKSKPDVLASKARKARERYAIPEVGEALRKRARERYAVRNGRKFNVV